MHSFRHNGDDRSLTGSADCIVVPDGFACDAACQRYEPDLLDVDDLFVGGSLLDEDSYCSSFFLDASLTGIDEPAQTLEGCNERSPSQGQTQFVQPRLVAIEVKKGQRATFPLLELTAHSGHFNQASHKRNIENAKRTPAKRTKRQ